MTAPKPEVVYLPAIFREIRRGATRIPAFQRGIVWNRKQILELLESVYKSYPIGSLLFWHAAVDQMRTDTGVRVPFPHPSITGTVDFVLDGMQRISSLYGAFHARPDVPESEDDFAAVFDLAKETFHHASEANENAISLRVLFSPRDLLAEQARLGQLKNGEHLVERSLHLQRAFQEYLVPVVRIGERSAAEVVEIFERVNSTGTRLSAVDFMRALTWSAEFDLSEELVQLAHLAATAGYEIPTDALAKCIALTLRVIPTAGEMLRLRQLAPRELKRATSDTREALTGTLAYLGNELGVRSYDYLPYEGQFLVLMSLVAATKGKVPKWAASWFWNTAFSESMQGKPDRSVAQLALDALEHPQSPLSVHFSLAFDDLRSRTVRKGTALSMAMVAAIATRPARSVFTGKRIPADKFMLGYDASHVAPIFSKSELEKVLKPAPRTDRLISNIVLLGARERAPRPSPADIRAAIVALSKQSNGQRALDAQCLTSDCVKAVKANDAKAFLDARTQAMLNRAAELSGSG
jgi:uncharacterized protein DUF262